MGESPRPQSGFWQALAFAWELGYAIAIPLVVLAVGGRFLDRWLGTSPWFLLAGIVLSVVLSSVMVTVKVARITRGTEV